MLLTRVLEFLVDDGRTVVHCVTARIARQRYYGCRIKEVGLLSYSVRKHVATATSRVREEGRIGGVWPADVARVLFVQLTRRPLILKGGERGNHSIESYLHNIGD